MASNHNIAVSDFEKKVLLDNYIEENNIGHLEDKKIRKLDVIELTLLLKSIGFRLESLDYGTFNNNNNKMKQSCTNNMLVNLDMVCAKTGLVAKLSYQPDECSCPTSFASQNNAFWEVQGNAPRTPNSKDILESSSNLLPNLQPIIFDYTNSMLQMAVKRIHSAIMDEKAAKTTKNVNIQLNNINIESSLLAVDNKQAIVSPINLVEPQAAAGFLTPLSSINVTPTEINPFVNQAVGVPKIILNSTDGKSFETAGESQQMDVFSSAHSSTDIFTSSPNNSDTQIIKSDRDESILQSLTDARSQIDASINLIISNLTHNLTQTSLLPISSSASKRLRLPASPRLSTNRRHSVSVINQNSLLTNGLLATDKEKKEVTPVIRMVRPLLAAPKQTLSVKSMPKPSTSSKIVKTIKPKSVTSLPSRFDTPRPGCLPLRSGTSSINAKPTLSVKTNLTKASSLTKLPTCRK